MENVNVQMQPRNITTRGADQKQFHSSSAKFFFIEKTNQVTTRDNKWDFNFP